MAIARQCDLCKKCFVPDHIFNNVKTFPRLNGSFVNSNNGQVCDNKQWDLCEDCFDKINTFIIGLIKEDKSC